MRRSLILFAVLAQIGCGGGSSPASPSPTPTPILNISISPCPSSVTGVDLGFYQQIGCNAFDGPMQSTRKWNVAPKLYLRTIDDAGAPIDAVTIDTVQSAMVNIAASFTGGKFGLASVERGTDTKDHVSGYVTVHWTNAIATCGLSDVAGDGGVIQFNPTRASCSCGGSKIFARGAAHELGHTFGYFHTDSPNDLMYGKPPADCNVSLSAREVSAMAYHYR